ncbi:MAG: FHA domain-containing protein [Nocardioides sp.]
MSDQDPTTRSYVPGEWYAVLGPSLVLALPPDRRDLAAAAWALVDAGGSSDEVLDLVLADGLSDLAGLALVSTEGERTRVVVRGRAVCLLDAEDGETIADGRAVTTWAEATADHVRAISLELGTTATGPALQVGDGLVRAARVLWPAEQQVVEQRGAPATSGRRDHDGQQPPAGRDHDDAQPPVGRGASAASLETPVWSPDSDDHDGLTRDGEVQPDLVRPPVGIPGQEPAPEVTAAPVARLSLSTGEEVEVDRVVIIGRAPEARRFTATQRPRLVAVPSPQQEISSTHLEVRPGSGADHGSAVVTDLGSTNGTLLTQPGLPQEPLRPGIPVQLLPGAVIDLGDGLTIAVDRP